MKELSDKLKEYNLKVTPQRLAIFHMLSNTDRHPSAETIYHAIEETYPSMSFATVYKTLDSLKKANLIQEINVGEDSFRYDASSHPHAHLICVSCHKVLDTPELAAVSELRAELCHKSDFEISNEQLFFYGKCRECQENK